MKQELIERMTEILRKQIGTESGKSILSGLLSNIDEAEAYNIIERAEGISRYNNFLCEDEAMVIVRDAVNFDGSSGPHWKDPHAMFSAVKSEGIEPDVDGEYNKWAWFAVMNSIWSDEWGILKTFIPEDNEVKVVAKLTEQRLTDPDERYRVREYFKV